MKRIGCINWESILGGGWFAEHTRLTLSDFAERTPYYAKRDENGLTFPPRTKEDYDRELQYAMDAGIDFFAHCWYASAPVADTKYNPGSEDLGQYIHQLSTARIFHQRSALREKLKLCAIIAAYEMVDRDYASLADAMRESYYEKTADGRPLVFVFDGLTPAAFLAVEQLLKATSVRGIVPYLVGMINQPPQSLTEDEKACLSQYDALSAYAQTGENITSNAAFYADAVRVQEARAKLDKPVIPLFSLGWNPMPRVKNPVPWVTYGDIDYAPSPTPEEIIKGAELLAEWTRKNAALCDPDFLLTFAWNEFEEGGWICPTQAPDGTPDISRITAFGKACEVLKNEQNEQIEGVTPGKRLYAN